MNKQELTAVFSNRLKELIDLLPPKFTVDDLARSCDISVPALNQYKRGAALPGATQLIKLADFFQVPVDVLLGRAEIGGTYTIDIRRVIEGSYEKYLGTKQPNNRTFENLNGVVAPWPYNLLDNIQDGISEDNRIQYPITKEQRLGLDYAISQTLTDRETENIYAYFRDERTLEEVGNLFNVGRERIRQITAKAIRKLRHPSRFRIIKYGTDILKTQDLQNEVDKKNLELQSQIAKLEHELATINAQLELARQLNAGGPDLEQSSEIVENVLSRTIDEMELSVRSYNCLKRAGCVDVTDVISKIEDMSIMNVRNLGRRSCREIASRLIEMGYTSKNTRQFAMVG